MNEVAIEELINSAIQQLNLFQLSESTIINYKNRAFKPVSDFYCHKEVLYYNTEFTNELRKDFQMQFKLGVISRNTFCWRHRGIGILDELYSLGCINWKVFSFEKKSILPFYFEQIFSKFIVTMGDIKRIGIYKSIIRRYLLYLSIHNHDTLKTVSCVDIKNFMIEISASRAKSMDDVVIVLKRLHMYLRDERLLDISFESILFVARARDKKIFPCIPVEEISLLTEQVNQKVPSGKRDYAILQLGIHTGLRAGDIVSLKLKDINWKKSEICLVQGKTQRVLILPLVESVGTALIDYILNGRPKTDSPYIFLRSIAPYQSFKDGVSIACVFRKYLKKANITHSQGDGRTFHGLRRTLGTEMVINEVPITTISQVLGHHNGNATKQYISLDTEGLRQCALGFNSIVEV